MQRDGTAKIGSWFYAGSGNFATELTEIFATYKRVGGTLPYDLTDINKSPKSVAMT